MKDKDETINIMISIMLAIIIVGIFFSLFFGKTPLLRKPAPPNVIGLEKRVEGLSNDVEFLRTVLEERTRLFDLQISRLQGRPEIHIERGTIYNGEGNVVLIDESGDQVDTDVLGN